jgi:hypothetical protein
VLKKLDDLVKALDFYILQFKAAATAIVAFLLGVLTIDLALFEQPLIISAPSADIPRIAVVLAMAGFTSFFTGCAALFYRLAANVRDRGNWLHF